MTVQQIRDSEGNERYFVMSHTEKGETTYRVWDRHAGQPVNRKEYATRRGAVMAAAALNRK